jgi:hypothetical protein
LLGSLGLFWGLLFDLGNFVLSFLKTFFFKSFFLF